jgi:signal transduction histidine kinase
VPLSEFILRHLEAILAEWEQFARTQQPTGSEMTPLQLRDHAEPMLRAIAEGMRATQTPSQQHRKSEGRARGDSGDSSAASRHGSGRQVSGFSLVQLNAEFRALRATVLRGWLPHVREFDEATSLELVRFNEAIDQAVAESLENYSACAASSRDTFLAILGHDLRSPLQTIAIAADYLGRPGIGSDETREVAGRVRRSTATIRAMVSDLLEYARGQLGNELSLDARPGDVGLLCRAVVGDLAATHPDCSFDLLLEGDHSGHFDRRRIEQALTNLLTNAVQYRGPSCGVALRVVGDHDELLLQVTNRGSVIPPSALDAIFDPMVQLAMEPGQTGRPSTSLGLGLFIARQIASAHGGSLGAESDAEHGTVFSLRLPRAGPALADEGPVSASPPR